MRTRGVSLLETLVALALIALTLLLAMPLVALEARIERRLEARREARTLLEAAFASVRNHPLGDPRAAELEAAAWPIQVAQDVQVAARSLPEPGPLHLSRLEVTVSWSVDGRREELRGVSLLWRER